MQCCGIVNVVFDASTDFVSINLNGQSVFSLETMGAKRQTVKLLSSFPKIMHRKEDPRSLIPELCRQFYHLGWVTGTGGGISIKDG